MLTAGLLLIKMVGELGVHGADVTGIQGWGVNTPCAAEVAAATWGLERVVHMPNGMMFFRGALSMMVAAGMLLPLVRFSGVISSWPGVVPKLHWMVALLVTSVAIF